MRVTPDVLSSSSFRVTVSLDHGELLPFFSGEALRKETPATDLYQPMRLLPLGLLSTVLAYSLTRGVEAFFRSPVNTLLGIGGAMLLILTTCCPGDFGLLSYIPGQKGEPETCDDAERGITYFFIRQRPGEKGLVSHFEGLPGA
jgi:hypothetical protein